MSTEEIKELIEKNRGNIAFLIGNGIHYQYKDNDKTWKDLLNELWHEYVGNEIDIPEGISLTEFYDVIELNYYKSSSFDYNELIGKITNNVPQDIKNKNKIQDIISKLMDCKPFYINNEKTDNLLCFCQTQEQLANRIKSLINKDFEDSNDVPHECIQYLLDILSNDVKKKIFENKIKKEVAKNFPPKDIYNLRPLIKGIECLKAPILTTNFDTYISDSINAKKFIFPNVNGRSHFTDFYPWNVYYSHKKLLNPLDGFSIWHINGIVDYPRSIKLGLSDYMGCVERARRLIQGKNLNEYFNGKNQIFWKGYNTWLHIIFNKNLFIFGLTLDENEVFLRWLLIQRAKYSEIYNKSLNGWYVNKGINPGKKFFLKQIGFDIIDLNDYSDLYNALELNSL